MFSFFLRRGNLFFSLAAAVFFVLVVWKAIHMGFTYDEAYSFLHYARASFADIFAYVGPLPANNHLLNTLSMKLFSSVFGMSEIFLRMGSILGTCMYIWGVFLFTRYFGQKYAPLYYMTPVLFFTNPYVFDFLVVARGYGLAMGFSMVAIYYAVQVIMERDTVLHAGFFLVFMSLATLANLSFLNLYLALSAIYFVYRGYVWLYERDIKLVLVRIGMRIISVLVLGGVYVTAVGAMKAADDLRFGGSTSIFVDTYGSLIREYLYESDTAMWKWIVLGVCVAVVSLSMCVAIVSVVRFLRGLVMRSNDKVSCGDADTYALVTIFLGAFVIVSCGLIIQNIWLGTPYLMSRTALFFYILFYLLVLSLLVMLGRWNPVSKRMLFGRSGLVYTVFGVGVVFLVGHFVSSLQMSYVPYWRADSQTRDMIQKIKYIALSETKSGERIVLDEDWWLEPVVQFYVLQEKVQSVICYDDTTYALSIDYRYLTYDSYEERQQRGETLQVVSTFPGAETVLVKIPK